MIGFKNTLESKAGVEEGKIVSVLRAEFKESMEDAASKRKMHKMN